MAKKEDKQRKLGILLIIVGFAMLSVLLLSRLDSSITGYAILGTKSLNSYGGETINMIVGDEITFTDFEFDDSCSNADCPGTFIGNSVTIDAVDANSACTCSVYDSGFNLKTITLNIAATTRTASTSDDEFTTTDGNTNIATGTPEEGFGSVALG